jgi:predicted GIY-YIG superfamily endonuclease
MSILYLIYNKDLKSFKIGIGDILGNRYKTHKRNGWVLVKYWYFSDRAKALAVEKAVLKELRKVTKSDHYLDKKHMPNGGYTETFAIKRIPKRKVINLINRLANKSLQELTEKTK